MLGTEIEMDKGRHTIPALGRKRQLLVADDDEAIQSLLSRTLSFFGYEVSLAWNGLEAMSLFLRGSYDLVITDFQMPLMDGWELSRLVKEHSPKTPVLVMTGWRDDANLEKLTLNGVDAILLKPFKLKEIEKAVQRLLNI